jgi:zinc/manganese transport system substrate-binding protein
VTNVARYVVNIERGLAAADPGGAETFRANAQAYLAQLDALDAEIRAAVAALSPDRRTVVTSHDAFGYFAADYGLTFLAPQGVSTEAEASARDVAALITQIRDAGIAAVFVENIADRRLLDQIAAETGAAIGGTLYSDALSEPEGPAASYLDMMRHNLGQLTAALTN